MKQVLGAYRRPPKAPEVKPLGPELTGGCAAGGDVVGGSGDEWGEKGRTGGDVRPEGGAGVPKIVPVFDSPCGLTIRLFCPAGPPSMTIPLFPWASE